MTPNSNPSQLQQYPGSEPAVDNFSTVVFADLSGSTALYETLGNARASQAVVRVTNWMSILLERYHGRVVKQLGDGVLGNFPTSRAAVLAVAELQRYHQINMARWPEAVRMPVRIGAATGEVVEVDGDTYGDAVNVASRLCERAQGHEIWVTEVCAISAGKLPRLDFRRLGVFDIRGRAESQVVYQVEWREENVHDVVTQIGTLPSAIEPLTLGATAIGLAWNGQVQAFSRAQVPLHLGRSPEAQLHVNDPFVSRLHARISWQQGAFALTDLSSQGTWVRFGDTAEPLRLHRDFCLLNGGGSISLGHPFGAGAPELHFNVLG